MHNGAGPGPVRLFPMKFVKNRACGVSGYGGPVGHGDFLLATNEQREMALPGAASAAACPTDSVKRHRRRHAFQFVVTKLLGYEHTRYLAQARRSGCPLDPARAGRLNRAAQSG
jgi:hypothetical protein